MGQLEPYLTPARSEDLRGRAYIIPLTFQRARIVADEMPGRTFEREFW